MFSLYVLLLSCIYKNIFKYHLVVVILLFTIDHCVQLIYLARKRPAPYEHVQSPDLLVDDKEGYE